MAKALKILAIISLLTLTSLLPLFSFNADAMIDGGGTTGPTPGTYNIYKPCYKYIAGTDYIEDFITFIDNDAYESGVVNEPYHFLASIWAGYNNQRVGVSFFLNYGHVYANQVDIGHNARFIFYQEKSWVGDLWKDENKTVHYYNITAGWSQLSPAPAGSAENAQGYYSNTSFLTSSSEFYPGIFGIDVYVYVTSSGYKKVATIYGYFTSGVASVKNVHDAAVWKEGEQPYTSIEISLSEGKWDVSLWYGGTTPPIEVEKGKVTNSEGKLIKDFGEWSGVTKTFRYNFTQNDSSGIYVWIITSLYGDSLLSSYSWTVYNNKPDVHPPRVTVTRTGLFKQGAEVHFYIKAFDDNSSQIKVWVIAWFGNNMYQMPDPATNLIVAYFKPFVIKNGGSADWGVQLNYYGNINLNIISEDKDGNWNITRVQYFVDKASGGGYTIYAPWFMWPWEDTTHLILLLIGLLFLLSSRSPLFRIIGLVLVAISFVRFDWLQAQLSNYFTFKPPGGIL
ncbi:hypothetical protein AciM339_0226 [Aciduliprofundum sp. MAR08-339]|uniref:hypothetical protein n=1 Tax=Aciduliprofundum sp. (strain MAR08-339) TaxID=673860 RepID=UPI0002A4A2E5|nr:hypothetical protein AciM339_0194 [Aciduliprofundum sp. MAR08-339]AGB04123.1 hypothetical protein AciM339_0226 [Aciduliprofundum sp. MAR08-339]